MEGGSEETGTEGLEDAAVRLRRIAEELADPETNDRTAVALAQEAATIAAEAGTAAAAAARAASERAENA